MIIRYAIKKQTKLISLCFTLQILLMKVYFLSVIILVSLFSCNKQQEQTTLPVNNKADSLVIKEKDIAKLIYTDYILDDRTEAVITNWFEYGQLQDAINKVKKGDFTFFRNNNKAISELLRNFKQHIPVEVNRPSILVRITSLETKIYKLESILKLSPSKKPEILELTKELLIAFSNLNLQMNKKLEADNIIIEKPIN